ncbi:MAG: hypothetical protein V8R98_03525 [Holdemanella sp.]
MKHLDVAGAHAPGVHGDDLLVLLPNDRLCLGTMIRWRSSGDHEGRWLELGLVAKAVALVGDKGKLVSINFFRRRFGGLTAGEMDSISPCSMASTKRWEKVRTALLDKVFGS